jgi:hypothetical protein
VKAVPDACLWWGGLRCAVAMLEFKLRRYKLHVTLAKRRPTRRTD